MTDPARARAEALFVTKPALAPEHPAPRLNMARCPVCQQHAATKRSPTWTYRGDACGEECGQKASRALRILHRSLKWRRAEAKRDAILSQMREMEMKAVLDAGGPGR